MGACDRRHTPDNGMIQKFRAIPRETRNKRLANERMRQLCTLLYAHTKTMLEEIKRRLFENEMYYKGNPMITGCFSFLQKAIDICFEK